MSLPVLYTPVKDPDTGHLLMDGGIYHNLPIILLNEREREETLSVLFVVNSPSQKAEMFDIFQNVYYSVTAMRNRLYANSYKDRVLCIPVDGLNELDFEKTREEKAEFIKHAQEKTREFLFTSSIKPIRRYSVS
jgi:predicted acylesterase/phospholipase RssA